LGFAKQIIVYVCVYTYNEKYAAFKKSTIAICICRRLLFFFFWFWETLKYPSNVSGTNYYVIPFSQGKIKPHFPAFLAGRTQVCNLISLMRHTAQDFRRKWSRLREGQHFADESNGKKDPSACAQLNFWHRYGTSVSWGAVSAKMGSWKSQVQHLWQQRLLQCPFLIRMVPQGGFDHCSPKQRSHLFSNPSTLLWAIQFPSLNSFSS
jgi:hypothetical protein